MNLKKNTIFIGNRSNTLQLLVNHPHIDLKVAFVIKDSPASKIDAQCEKVEFDLSNKNEIFNRIKAFNFDILISNGCPFILPISQLKTNNQLFINIHPSYLPELKGIHPINGTFYLGYNHYGATVHYMDDGIDTGNIIYQEKHELTPDIDLDLLYHLAFTLESQVLSKALEILKNNNFNYFGNAQNENGSYYTRKAEDMILDFKTMSSLDLLKKIKSFGTKTLGCTSEINGEKIKIFAAEQIINTELLNKNQTVLPGEVAVKLGDKWLIKTIDGLLKLNDISYL